MTELASIERGIGFLIRAQKLAGIASENLHAAQSMLDDAMATGSDLTSTGVSKVWNEKSRTHTNAYVYEPQFNPSQLVQFGGAEGAATGALEALTAAKAALTSAATDQPTAYAPAMTSIDDAMRAAAELRDAGNLLRRGAQAQLVDLRDVALAYRGDRPVWVVSRPAGPDAYSKLFPEAGGRDPALKMVAERRQVPDPRGKHPIFRHERTVTHSAWRLQVPTVPDAIFRSLDEIRPDPVIQGQLSAAAEAARSAEEGRQLGGLFMQSTKAHIRDVLDAGT